MEYSGQKISAMVTTFYRRKELREKSTSNFAEKNSGLKGSRAMEGHTFITKTLFPPINLCIFQSTSQYDSLDRKA